MTHSSISFERLHNQLITNSRFRDPADVVRHLGAVQAQDYFGSLWGIGLRTKEATEASVEKAISDKTMVRSWPMRNTLHFVPSQDLRWMLNLLSPRMIAQRAGHHRMAELDKKVFAKTRRLLTRAMEGGHRLTRTEVYELLERAKIATQEQRGLHILAHHAQEGLICFGPRKGKQHTFTLLDEWIPASKILNREEGLAELAQRYFQSHGPATLRDFSWWSGLTMKDAKEGLEMVKAKLVSEVSDDNIRWMPDIPAVKGSTSLGFLLPAYDEYTVGYKDRGAILDPRHAKEARNGIFNPVIVQNGRIVGTWKRTIAKDKVDISIHPFRSIFRKEFKDPSTEHYQSFMAGAPEANPPSPPRRGAGGEVH